MSGLTKTEWKHLELLLKAVAEIRTYKDERAKENQAALLIFEHRIDQYDPEKTYRNELSIDIKSGHNIVDLRSFEARTYDARIRDSHHQSTEPRYEKPPQKELKSDLNAKSTLKLNLHLPACTEAEKQLSAAQFVSDYKDPENGGGLNWNAQMTQRWENLKKASQEVIKARENYYQEDTNNILPLIFHIPSLGPVNIIHQPLSALYSHHEQHYFQSLWMWVHADAAGEDTTAILKDMPKQVEQVPHHEASLNHLVHQGIALEMDHKKSAETRQHEWQNLQRFAAIKFGPTALFHAFKGEYDQALIRASIASNPVRLKALKRACVIITGLTIITVCVALAVLSYGSLTVPAALGVKIGAGIVAGGLAGTDIYKGALLGMNLYRKNKAEKHESVVRFFCKEKDADRAALPEKLSVRPKKT